MKQERFYLAADAGGSKTVWILLDEQGNALKKVRTSGLGAAKEGLLPVLQTVSEAKDTISSFGNPCAIFLSLGGLNVSEVRNALKTVFGETVPICVEREACGRLYGMLCCGDVRNRKRCRWRYFAGAEICRRLRPCLR